MEDEIEDIVGDVKLSESQKSVATTVAYSLDFTDSCTDASDKNNSSGKDTYVIEKDDSDDSGQPLQREMKKSLVHVKDKGTTPFAAPQKFTHQSTSVHQCSLVREIFTQTSQTVIELADIAKTISRKNNLETQTSFVSITESKTIEYRVAHMGIQHRFADQSIVYSETQLGPTSKHTLTDASSKYYGSRPRIDYCKSEKTDGNDSADSSNAIMPFSLSKDRDQVMEYRRDTSETDDSSRCSDMDEDSLIESNYKKSVKDKPNLESQSDVSDIPKSIDNEVDELYKKLYESIQQNSLNKSTDNEIQSLMRLSTLTPLTEESTLKKDSSSQGDVTSKNKTNPSNSPESNEDDVLFVSNTGIKVRVLKNSDLDNETQHVKLPPIQKNQSCPNSPHLNFLFSVNASKPLNKAGTMPCLLEGEMENPYSKWDLMGKDIGSGESPIIGSQVDSMKIVDDILHLPPIQVVYPNKLVKEQRNYKESRIHHEARSHRTKTNPTSQSTKQSTNKTSIAALFTPISINEKINELKDTDIRAWTQSKPPSRREVEAHCSSPEATTSSSQSDRMSLVAEKGCEGLCVEMLQKLKSSSWFEVADTLQEIPKCFDKFWGVLSENRTADLIRQVITHIESPRTQVARSACQTLAEILKNTNYTKKPDFYEAMTMLLTKTGSFSRAVRRAANIALDEIVCNVDYSHAITALCVHGVRHKSSVVRCAAARLLVVGCAVAGGGRRLLRTKPVRVATARNRTLTALASLIDDKCADARKYAERLYIMLRPLPHFEAFYLTDVDVDIATRQMKKYDRLLLNPPKDR